MTKVAVSKMTGVEVRHHSCVRLLCQGCQWNPYDEASKRAARVDPVGTALEHMRATGHPVTVRNEQSVTYSLSA